ncbi:MAG TPA: transposase [Blastocatellia bacterium]|nr:transposase [Blastocatellia bacterium]
MFAEDRNFGEGQVFWHRSYCLITSGGSTIEKLRKYIEEQGSE